MMLRVGIVISLILHVLILAWALVEMRSVREFAKVEPTPVSIDLLQIADKTDLKAGDSKAKPKAVKAAEDKPKVEAEKPKRVAVEPPKVEPPKVEPAKVEPAKVEPPKVEPKKEEPKKEEPKADPKKVEDAAKVEPPKPDAVDPVAELLKKEEEQK